MWLVVDDKVQYVPRDYNDQERESEREKRERLTITVARARVRERAEIGSHRE